MKPINVHPGPQRPGKGHWKGPGSDADWRVRLDLAWDVGGLHAELQANLPRAPWHLNYLMQ